MGRIISVSLIGEEELVVVWGVKEIIGIEPREELDFDVSVTYYSEFKATEMTFQLSSENIETRNFNIVFSFENNTRALESLINGKPLVLFYADAPTKELLKVGDINALMNEYGGVHLYLPSNTKDEIQFHGTLYQAAKGD
ncbi:hypothetical protein [Paenibacillus endoradicis]|uniref:hypothetical protein n=1 Tax=Paenibacillus endoradicis TaxID=2972487 RepID=UPI0021595D9C|nr:hypothetical protein [Paenibacillus endoradicis]MCR8656943.1 hypothetical protein [Paenibacillus endoradicis]